MAFKTTAILFYANKTTTHQSFHKEKINEQHKRYKNTIFY